ncbi:hypothetical protein ABKN59_006139 [Abortiporus biennis]
MPVSRSISMSGPNTTYSYGRIFNRICSEHWQHYVKWLCSLEGFAAIGVRWYAFGVYLTDLSASLSYVTRNGRVINKLYVF